MEEKLKFFETMYISIFDFKSYTKFMNMKFSRVFLNRVLFVLLISVFYVIASMNDIRILSKLDSVKQEIFQDINYSDGILNISNSPIEFKYIDFALVGDTREEVNVNDILNNYNGYKNIIVLSRDTLILKSGFNKLELKYADFSTVNLNKETILFFISTLLNMLKYVLYIVLPSVMIFDFFFVALITSLLAFLFSILFRFKSSFSQVYKMILFAQGVPFLIISIFQIIARLNNVNIILPGYILQSLTIMIFLISLFSIIKNRIVKKD